MDYDPNEQETREQTTTQPEQENDQSAQISDQPMHADTVWATLNSINTNNAVKVTPTGIKYIPWSQAWRMLKDKYPDAREEITEFPEYEMDKNGHWYATGRTVDYRKTSAGVQVEVSVVIGNQRFTCRRPVCAGGFNKIIMNPNYNDINTAQMRCLVKAIAMAGLGLNLYYGEDFEEGPQSAGQDQQYANFRRVGNRQPQVNQAGRAPQAPQPQVPNTRKVNINQLAKSDLLKLGQNTLFTLPNGRTINASSLLLRAFEERKNAQTNGGEVGMYYNTYYQLACDKRNHELFSQLSSALGLKK